MKTMAVWLECPVCEYRFSVPEDFSNKAGKCPKCEKAFNAADCQLPEKKLSADPEELEIPAPLSLSQINSGDATSSPVPEVIVNTNGGKPKTKKPARDKPDESLDTNMPFVPANKTKTDPNKVLFLIIGSCVAALLLLIGIPLIASSLFSGGNEEDKKTVASSTGSDEVSSPIRNSDPEKKSGVKNKKRKGKGKGKGKAPNSGNQPKLDSNALSSVWKTIAPSFVVVMAKRKSETVTSHGVVISKDGAIAVNWNQVKDADSIRIKFPADVYNGSVRWQKPIQVQKIIGKNEALGVAILHVNQVTAPVKARSPEAAAGPGVIPVLTNLKAPEYLRQTRIRPTELFTDLSDAQKSILTGDGLAPDPATPIMIHTAIVNKTGKGVPVFDEAGLFAGMHFVYDPEGKLSYGLPLSVLNDIANDPNNSVTSLAPVEKVKSVDSDQNLDFREALELMNESEWALTKPGFYGNAQKFALSWLDLEQENLSAGFARKNEIEELKKESVESQRRLLIWPPEKTQTDVNRLAAAALESKTKAGWFGLVKVLQPPGMAPILGEDASMLVHLVGTSHRVLLISRDVEGPFVQGTEWMVFATTNNRIVRAGGEKYHVLEVVGVKGR